MDILEDKYCQRGDNKKKKMKTKKDKKKSKFGQLAVNVEIYELKSNSVDRLLYNSLL